MFHIEQKETTIHTKRRRAGSVQGEESQCHKPHAHFREETCRGTICANLSRWKTFKMVANLARSDLAVPARIGPKLEWTENQSIEPVHLDLPLSS